MVYCSATQTMVQTGNLQTVVFFFLPTVRISGLYQNVSQHTISFTE